MRVVDMIKIATAEAEPEDRRDLMNIQTVSRGPEESDEEWLERIIRILKPLYQEE